MKCVRCNDERMVWTRDKFNKAVPTPCPDCNPNGQAVRSEIADMQIATKTTAPTALNKRGKKVVVDGYTFDSQKEANFYTRFVKGCGLPFEVHPRFKLTDLTQMPDGVAKISAISYSPDFLIKNHDGSWKHVIDVKNSFGVYGIEQSVKLRFRLFALRYKHPVEAVVVRTKDFKVITQGVTKSLNEKEPFITENFDYHWKDATNY